MKILFLGDDAESISWLKSIGEEVINTTESINVEFAASTAAEFIVSYNYRHVLPKDIIDLFKNRAVNLHISFLPWNRGADPNFWSFVDDTPKGVTIHYMDEGIDTGPIIAQWLAGFDDNDTLRTSYEKLHKWLRLLFQEHWQNIKSGKCVSEKQNGEGSYHRRKDKESLAHLLAAGWDTPIAKLIEYAADVQMARQFWQ